MEAICLLEPARPVARTVVIELPGVPGLQGNSARGESYGCPSCGALLLERVDKRKVERLIFRCPQCGACSGLAIAPQ